MSVILAFPGFDSKVVQPARRLAETGRPRVDAARQRYESLRDRGLLPAPAGVAAVVCQATGDAGASIETIARQLRADPALAGRLLHYANLTRGDGATLLTSSQAIGYLGLFRVRQIALAFSLLERHRSGSCEGFAYFAHWACSLAMAIAARHLAPEAMSPPDESFTCGLLAGVGRLGLATAFPREYSALLESGLVGVALGRAERERFGIDHARLSAEMLADWGLPAIFANAVRYHENPAESPVTPDSRAYALTAGLHLAYRLARLLNLEESRRWERLPSLFHAAASLGLDVERIPTLAMAVADEWQEWGRELDLPIRSHAGLPELFAGHRAVPDRGEALDQAGRMPVTLLMAPSERRQELAATLSVLGLEAVVADDEAWASSDGEELARVLVMDLGDAGSAMTAKLKEARRQVGDGAHVIALIQDTAESRVAELLLAGASDYLPYGYSQAALIARLAIAQQMLALRGAVRAEWQSAIDSSGTWARANRRLLREALTDPLTQLPNRRHGLDRLDQEWSVAVSNELPLACLMLDIDHFKAVNDLRGHDIGDQVLQQVAASVLANCRRSDVLFRFGGEEFCCICPQTGLEAASQLAARIVGAVARGRYGKAEDGFPVTISIGVAARSGQTSTPADLVAQADQALYSAKAQGRNRTVSWSG